MEAVLRATRYLGAAAITLGAFEAAGISLNPIYDVDAGTRAVIFDKFQGGTQDKCIGEGTHFRWPWQEPRIMDIRTRPRTIHTSTGTKDLQTVNVSLRVLSRPDVAKLPHILKSLGPNYDETVFENLGNEVLKAVVAQYNADELLSKRASVSMSIRTKLVEKAAKFNLILDDVAITHLTFGREFARAIENKQVAQQEAETQLYLVAKAEQERKAAVIRAEGESEAAHLMNQAFVKFGAGLIEVRRIDTAKEVAQILAKSRNIVYLPSGSNSGNGSNMLLGVNTNSANEH